MISRFYLRNYLARKKLIFKLLTFWIPFSFIYFSIINQFIDLPRDQKVLEYFTLKIENNSCEVNIPVCKIRDLISNGQVVGQVCDLPVNIKNNNALVQLLGLENSIFQRQVCIYSETRSLDKPETPILIDTKFVIEQEDEKGNSLFDIREFGKLTNDGHCLALTETDSEVVIPIQIVADFTNNSETKIQIIRNLVNQNTILFALYSVTFIFCVSLYKAASDLIKIYKEFLSN